MSLYLARNTAPSAAAACAQLGTADWQTLEDMIILWNTAKTRITSIGAYCGHFVLRHLPHGFPRPSHQNGQYEIGVIAPADPVAFVAFICETQATQAQQLATSYGTQNAITPAPTYRYAHRDLIDQSPHRARYQDERLGRGIAPDGRRTTLNPLPIDRQPGINRKRYGLTPNPTTNEED